MLPTVLSLSDWSRVEGVLKLSCRGVIPAMLLDFKLANSNGAISFSDDREKRNHECVGWSEYGGHRVALVCRYQRLNKCVISSRIVSKAVPR
jgi:hypothetical protein